MLLTYNCEIDTITEIKEYQVPQSLYFYHLYTLTSMLVIEKVSSKSQYLSGQKFTINRQAFSTFK